MLINDNLKNLSLFNDIVLKVEKVKNEYIEKNGFNVNDIYTINLYNIYNEIEEKEYTCSNSEILKFLEEYTYYKYYNYIAKVEIEYGYVIIKIYELRNY